MQEGDLVSIDLLVQYCGNRKSKKAWSRIREDLVADCTQCDNWNVRDNIYTIHCLGCTRCTHNSDLFEQRKVVTDEQPKNNT